MQRKQSCTQIDARDSHCRDYRCGICRFRMVVGNAISQSRRGRGQDRRIIKLQDLKGGKVTRMSYEIILDGDSPYLKYPVTISILGRHICAKQ